MLCALARVLSEFELSKVFCHDVKDKSLLGAARLARDQKSRYISRLEAGDYCKEYHV